MNLAWNAYRGLAAVAGALAPAARFAIPGPERETWSERLGEVPVGPVDAWIHAASLGEAVAACALADALERRAPGARLHFTATTRDGRERLAARGAASLAPLDSPQAAERFLARLQPRRVFLLETELWPHWLSSARRRGVPAAAISARLSPRSLRRLSWLGPDLRGLVANLEAVLCHGEGDRERWLALGARPERTVVTGNLKLDALPARATDVGARRLELGLDRDRPVLVLGSLRPGEARILGETWAALDPRLRARWQVVAVPRHTRATAGLRAEVASRVDRETGDWRWEDRSGALGDYYAIADAAFVGGSLVPFGGHNPLEPAACGLPVMMGPHTRAQQDSVEMLVRAGALLRVEEGTLRATLARLLGDGEERTRRGAAGRLAVDALRGVAVRAVERLVEWKLWPAS